MFDHSQFLDLANEILADSKYGHECGWRTAIGRAYYAAFLASKKQLESLGSSFANVDKIHREVIQDLMQKNSSLANQLDTLRDNRVKADYNMQSVITVDLGQNSARLSERIISSIQKLK